MPPDDPRPANGSLMAALRRAGPRHDRGQGPAGRAPYAGGSAAPAWFRAGVPSGRVCAALTARPGQRPWPSSRGRPDGVRHAGGPADRFPAGPHARGRRGQLPPRGDALRGIAAPRTVGGSRAPRRRARLLWRSHPVPHAPPGTAGHPGGRRWPVVGLPAVPRGEGRRPRGHRLGGRGPLTAFSHGFRGSAGKPSPGRRDLLAQGSEHAVHPLLRCRTRPRDRPGPAHGPRQCTAGEATWPTSFGSGDGAPCPARTRTAVVASTTRSTATTSGHHLVSPDREPTELGGAEGGANGGDAMAAAPRTDARSNRYLQSPYIDPSAYFKSWLILYLSPPRKETRTP